MEKIKKYAAIFFIVLISAGLYSCGGGKTVRPEVAEAYSLDAAGNRLIAGMFKEFDAAFAELKRSDKITDSDLYDYADTVIDAYDNFDNEFEEYWESLSDNISSAESKTKEKYMDIQFEQLNLSMNLADLSSSRTRYMIEGGSGEAIFEEAVNFVDTVSMLFYGEHIFSDDDLDALADKLE